MPPTRTVPPVKAVKTERTHEENQERAYIAASRRSDRSLEARVESARRASEIHKRRTGRSLRVTEQDVINEEMYEEEDDDLPLQYRRLTAHLQTGSTDFNRRLAAYLTNQVAMRSAVGQMVNSPYGHPFPNQFQPNMFQTPMMPQQQMPISPGGTFRPAPYPSPHHPGFRQPHGRAYSTALPAKVSTPPTPGSNPGMDHRRMSTPAMQPPHLETDGLRSDGDYLRQTQSAMSGSPYPQQWQSPLPFTTSLPPESQQMLAGTLDPNDPFNAMLMSGSQDFMSNPYYPWGNMQGGVKGMPVHPSAYPGMAATLAPSALDASTESAVATPSTSTHTIDGQLTNLDHSSRSGLTPPSKFDEIHQNMPSGQNTPGEGFWDSFVQDGGWHDEIPSSQ